MGASGWSYVVPLAEGPRAALAGLRDRVLAEDDYYWEADYLGAKPRTVADLDRLRETEEFWEVGTHSILDVDWIVDAEDEAHDGTVRQLPDDAAHEAFGTTTPTRAQFDAAADTIPYLHRWSGLYQLLYVAGRPAEVAFWGFSGD